MKTVIIHKPHLCTKLQIWAPRYSDKYGDIEEWVALLAQYKIQYASPMIIVEFTRAQHLLGQRFCILKETVMRCKKDSNGKIPMYAVPLTEFSTWESAAEAHDIAAMIFEN